MIKQENTYYENFGKRILDLFLSLIAVFVFFPLAIVIAVVIMLDSKGSIIFKQKRVGKNGKEFFIYKFRTMFEGAEKLKRKYLKLNEADGPVFKINNDPRFTKVGKYLARTGLDELPQIINILKGEMSLVGPRPLPVVEAQKIDVKMRTVRESVLPGITSLWIVSGAHDLSFQEWMRLDKKYISDISFANDFEILESTATMILRSCLRLLFN